jgi:hypothetical protein
MTILPEHPLVELTELSSADQKLLGSKHPEVAGQPSVLLSAGNQEALQEFRDVTRLLSDLPDTEGIRVVKEALQSMVSVPDRASLKSIAEMVSSVVAIRKTIHERLECADVHEAATAAEFHVARNVQSRAAFVAELSLLTVDQLRARFGVTADELDEWERLNRILSIEYMRTRYFPAFEFDAEGRPLPVVSAVVRLFGKGGWETALWFTSSNGWLNGGRPVDVLPRDPDAVIEAADQEVGFAL